MRATHTRILTHACARTPVLRTGKCRLCGKGTEIPQVLLRPAWRSARGVARRRETRERGGWGSARVITWSFIDHVITGERSGTDRKALENKFCAHLGCDVRRARLEMTSSSMRRPAPGPCPATRSGDRGKLPAAVGPHRPEPRTLRILNPQPQTIHLTFTPNP